MRNVFQCLVSPRLQSSRFFLEIGKARCKSLTRAKQASLTSPQGVWGERKKTSVSPQSRPPFSASFQIFCLTARAYLNTQKYGLFCSLGQSTCCRARGAVFKVRGPIHLFWSVVREGGGGVGLWALKMVYLVPIQYVLITVTTHQSFF